MPGTYAKHPQATRTTGSDNTQAAPSSDRPGRGRRARRGVEVYGDAAHKEEWLLDLRGRVTKLQARIDRENATPPRQQETLVCQTCGAEFTRAVTTGRKPLNCPACR